MIQNVKFSSFPVYATQVINSVCSLNISEIARRVGITEEEVIEILEKNKYKVNS